MTQRAFRMMGRGILLVLMAFTLIACGSSSGGGGDDPGTTIKTGKFIDSAVNGLQYESGGQSGSTDAQGNFSYEEGARVRFYIGDILIGEVTGKSIITPVDLVAGAVDETNETVTNICSFLLTLDDDNDPGNGINIGDAVKNAAVGMTVNFAQTINEFANGSTLQSVIADLTAQTSTGLRQLVTGQYAQNHLRGTLLSTMAGNYSGTFTGDASGTWTITVDSDGNISGSAYEPGYGTTSAVGTLLSSGSMTTVVGLTSDGTTFSGNFSLDGVGSGTWVSPYWGESGTWSGRKVS